MLRLGLIFGAAVARMLAMWVVIAGSTYAGWKFYAYPAQRPAWVDPAAWKDSASFEGAGTVAASAWADPTFLRIAVCVAGLLLVWTCFVSALLACLAEVQAGQEVSEQAHRAYRLQDL